ncbi:hypothetical protein CHS0354_025532, partial [Potamilus streckersoni]
VTVQTSFEMWEGPSHYKSVSTTTHTDRAALQNVGENMLIQAEKALFGSQGMYIKTHDKTVRAIVRTSTQQLGRSKNCRKKKADKIKPIWQEKTQNCKKTFGYKTESKLMQQDSCDYSKMELDLFAILHKMTTQDLVWAEYYLECCSDGSYR